MVIDHPPTHAKIKPVYDVSAYGEDLTFQLSADNLTLQSITASTSTFEKWNDSVILDGTVTTVFPIEDMDIVATDNDVFSIAHEGNITSFDRIYSVEPDMTAMVYKASIKAAFGLNISAYTSGSFAISSVRFIINQVVDSLTTQKIDEFVIPSTLSALTATGSQVFIIVADRHYTTFKAIKGRPITIQIQVNMSSVAETATWQVGLLPLFPFQKEALLKPVTSSVLSVHVHPTLDHAFPVFRDQNSMQLLDYAGTSNPDGAGVG